MSRDDQAGPPAPAWRRYLRFWRTDARGDVDDEVGFHIASLVDELTAQGWTRESAEREARRRFGDVSGLSRQLHSLSLRHERAEERAEWLEQLRQDARFGVRQLLRAPGFTIIALVTLALGIGANSAIFSAVYGVVLKPLPFANADRVVSLWESTNGQRMSVTHGNFDVWRREATDFAAIGARRFAGPLTLTGYGDPVPVTHLYVSAGYWQTLYAPPARGAYFGEDYDRPGAEQVAVISYPLWQGRLGGDRGIIGRQLILNGEPYRVVAVASPDYGVTIPGECIWTPLAMTASQLADHGDHELSVNALVRPGVTREAAVAQLTAIETRLAGEYPNKYFDGTIQALSLIDSMVGDLRFLLYILMGAVGCVLLIACGNVANLLIARTANRRQEIAIRGALGASRRRIVTQLLVESAILYSAAAVAGLGVAFAGMKFLAVSPVSVARLDSVSLNGPVLAFTLGLSLACGIVFGLLPARRAASVGLQQALRDGGRENRGAVRERLRGALTIAELGLAQVLLVGAGLLLRSATAVSSIGPGFDTANLLVASLSLPSTRYHGTEEVEAGFARIEREIAAIPGVRGVARTQVAPIYSGGWNWTAFREGSTGVPGSDGSATADMRGVTPGYFSLLGVRLVAGREFAGEDRAGAPPVAIVSRGLARRLFGEENPIGRLISNQSAQKPGWMEIVGVADDIRADGLVSAPPLMLYRPAAQWVNGGQMFMVRGSVPVTTLVPAIRRAVSGVDALLAVSRVSTIESAMAQQTAVPRFTTWLLALLGGTGLILAVVGVYGVISYVVSQRTHEFGVRMALGAGAARVRWMVVRQGVTLGALGIALGTVVSLLATRTLQSFLYGVTTRDPVTYASVAALLLAVAALAGYLPARRATRIDPLEALRG